MSEASIGYSEGQLSAIRRTIAGLPALTPEDVSERDAAASDGRCPARLWPLWPLAGADGALWRLLNDDERIPEFSVYGLFPAAYDIVYGDGSNGARVRYDGRTRGRVAIISGRKDDAPAAVVIKPSQSPSEPEIVVIAGELGVGPEQSPSIAGFISEKFVNGPFLTDLTPAEATTERMRGIGEALAVALSNLHAAGICYNDATISDPDGRSHVIVQPDGGIRLIDFGVALLLRDHPTGLTFHDAYNAARTDPMFRLFRQMTPEGDANSLGRFVADYGRRLAGQTAAEIQSRDWRIADEGATMIARRFGPAAADALREGLSAGR